jgi:hypothetical protein
MQRVQEGWKTETYEVPVYKERKVKVGTRTVYDRVPDYKWQKVPSAVNHNADSTPTPPPPLSTPHPEPVPTPQPFSTPYPYTPTDPQPIELDDPASTVARGIKFIKKAKGIWNSTALAFNRLSSGHYSVSAPGKPPGSKLAFRLKQGFAGTRYTVPGLAKRTANQLLSKSASGLGLSLGLSVGVNMYDYGLGKHRDKGIRSNEFLASTAVDFAHAGLSGLAAAGVVAGGIALAGLFGFSLIATAPLWAAALGTAGLGVAISAGINKIWDMDKVKQNVADGFKTFPGIVKNGKTIISVGSKRAKDAIANKAMAIKTAAIKGTQDAIGEVTAGIDNAKNKVKNFVGNLFGGKD